MSQATPSSSAITSQPWLRVTALVTGVLGVLVALATPSVSAWIEGGHSGSGITLFDDKIAATATFHRLWFVYTLLGGAAVMLSITAYLTGGFGRSGRVALALGVVALAWKYAIYAFVIALVAMFVLNFGA